MATELISFNPSSKQFAVAPKAVDILKKLHGPVAIVSVCGRARMGKSTLLNQLLSKLSGGTQQGAKGGFTVASTHKPCTKGLWIWSKPIERTMPDGRKMHLVGHMGAWRALGHVHAMQTCRCTIPQLASLGTLSDHSSPHAHFANFIAVQLLIDCEGSEFS